MIYPIAEIFDSIQGEGSYTGTPMTFVRLAGCNVGRSHVHFQNPPLTPAKLVQLGEASYHHPEHTFCAAVTGEQFLCDTDYRTKEKLSVEALLDRCRIADVCLTGGEPFLHDLVPLLDALNDDNHTIHIETSGTKPILRGTNDCWITCSPKVGFLPENFLKVDEFKFLVSSPQDLALVEKFFDRFTCAAWEDSKVPIYIQPIQDVEGTDPELARAIAKALVNEHPSWRLSAQLHKYLKMR